MTNPVDFDFIRLMFGALQRFAVATQAMIGRTFGARAMWPAEVWCCGSQV